MKRSLKFPMSFEKGKREITNKRSQKPADKAFNSYYAWLRENISESQQSVLEKEIESARKAGWSRYSITLHRKKYVLMPGRGPRKHGVTVRKKNLKKNIEPHLTSSDSPEVTKTMMLAAIADIHDQEK